MLRFKLGLFAAALTAGAVVGCAQCDTCDDFPAPCIGSNCGGGPGPLPVAHHAAAPGDYSMVGPGQQGGPLMLPPGAPLPPGAGTTTSVPSSAGVPSGPSTDVPPPPAVNQAAPPANEVSPPVPNGVDEMVPPSL